MDEPIFSEFSKEFSRALMDYCEAAPLEPAFVANLERQLLERQAASRSASMKGRSFQWSWQQLAGSFALRRWQVAILLLLATLTITLLIIGPARVLAQVQHWLGYVPGIGFVDLEQSRILASPLSVQQEGVTLTIEMALAMPNQTVIIFSSQGLPEESAYFPSSRLDYRPEIVLQLPDGSTVEAVMKELEYGGGKVIFPALPGNVVQVTFEIDRMPLLPAGAAPEDWQVPLLLRPASGDTSGDLFLPPYTPQNARVVDHGVEVQVLQVALSAEETALQVQFNWENPGWVLQFQPPLARLRDDLGMVYQPISPYRQLSRVIQEYPTEIEAASPTPEELSVPIKIETLTFPALSLGAREIIFQLEAVEFLVTDTASFTFDPGEDPQLGQTWELDVPLEVAGIPLNLVGARLGQSVMTQVDGEEPYTSLEFSFMTPVDLPRSLTIFFLGTDREDYHGGGGGTREPGVFKIEMLFDDIPQQPFQITIERVRIALEGPWEVRWQVSPMDKAAIQSYAVRPQGAEATHAGVTLHVDQAIFNDRVSVIELAAPALPSGGRLLNVLAFDPSTADLIQDRQLFLSTQLGERIDLAQNISWQPGGELQNPPGRFVFAPLPPLTDRVTLHVPAVELFLPGQAFFDIDIPENVAFQAEEFTVPVFGKADGQQEATQTRWLSDPWEVEFPIEIAGYQLHFTRAQIERDFEASIPYALILTSEPINRTKNGVSISAVQLAGITRPDGQVETGEELNEMMRWYGLLYDRILTEDYNPQSWQVKIRISVADTAGLDILPGRYRIEISGMTAWADGPWELSWSLSDN